jgi:hypothetical protein
MRLMRALIYLVLPSVAFGWLLRIEFPPARAPSLPWGPSTTDLLLEALWFATLGLALLAAAVVVVRLVRYLS